MIKAIIFDLDGVLVDTKKIHFEALNISLKKFKFKEISVDDHEKIYDGLPTLEKLNILNKKEKLPKTYFSKINKYKQHVTSKILKKRIKKNFKIIDMIKYLHNNYKIAVATNAVTSTLNICLNQLGIKKYVDFRLSNENIKYPKPNPEIYLRIFIEFGIYPSEALIIEDSHYGREAAISSGAKLLPIKKIEELNLKKIKINLKSNKALSSKKVSWSDSKMNVLIPMAGEGSRFKKAGYTFPKPLIEVDKKPMIQFVIENLSIEANFIFLARKEHEKKYNIKSLLNVLAPDCKVIIVNKLTQGAASTTLLAKNYIDNKNPLIIANSDQYIEWNSSKSMYKFMSKKNDAAILTFKSIHPKWSYAKLDKNGNVSEVAEKKVISDNATVGIYFWKKGSDYVKYAKQMIKKNIRVNNEFYVCPVFNEAIKDKKKIIIEEVVEMWGLGTPEDLDHFLKNKKI